MYRIGIDVGGMSCKAGIVDMQGKILFKKTIKTGRERHPDAIVEDIGAMCASLIDDSGIAPEQIKSIGAGCPGTPDKAKGTIVYSNNIRFDNTDIRGIIQKYVKKDVFVDNDANCAALAEARLGICRGAAYSVTITLGTGIGGGAVLDKKLYSGFNYGAPEIGHMAIKVGGRKCTCGRRGCFEQYASATALIADTKKAMKKYEKSLMWKLVENDISKVSARTAFEAMKAGDAAASETVNQYVFMLAQGLANVINIFQPEVIALGGGVSNEGELLLDMLVPIVMENVYTRNMDKNCRLAIATMGNDAGLIGAAMLDE